MIKRHSLVISFYDRFVLEHPRIVILGILLLISFLGYKAADFRLDASTETLIIETDEDLRYSRLINSRYGGYDYLLITYSPKADLFSEASLKILTQLRDELKKTKRVTSVVSILDAPLLESPPVPVKELTTNIQTLESPKVDRKLARIEFKNSPLYQNLLVSPDLKTTGLQVNFPIDEVYQNLLARRDHFREKAAKGNLTDAEIVEFKALKKQIQRRRELQRQIRNEDIAAIRVILDKYRQDAQLFLGGISVITDDLIRFVKQDLKIFGIGIALFLIITLSIIFGKIRWVVLPMLCCVFSAIAMMGLLGMFGWKVTVISSNFISLQLIITMAITIHLIVRYKDLAKLNPEADQRQLILDTVSLMLTPCLYAALTTTAGFGSLLLCDILPVRTFGWMMSAGILVSLIITFLLFPAGLMLLGKEAPQAINAKRFSFTSALARFTEARGTLILCVSCLILIMNVFGITRLVVENSFINYFKDDTEIYQGLKVIDERLGGTTPLDVIVELEIPQTKTVKAAAKTKGQADEAFDEFDEFEEGSDEKYWFTADRMALAMKIHDYLDSLPETGKVLSLATMLKIATKLNKGQPLDNFQLALVYSELPEEFKRIILKPYVSPRHHQLRYSIRVKDSEKSLRREVLLKKIRYDLVNRIGLSDHQVHLTGLLVLYNNMLQSLFKSQILTLAAVVLVLFGMFLILFRSLQLALIALIPNLLAISTVLGIMGWLKIPLDMMTITIAAISIGIAVDNTIHYIYRFRQEFQAKMGYMSTVHLCHGSIGRALYYTSLTIISGFLILTLSNFIPSIYFGLLTALAMSIALLAALTLLPQLIIVLKPLGSESTTEAA
ncbi:MAG: MMPL family transporter [Deltaproteobacteria bacterium]|jgi:predicted RND superfamily exporter protein|nr:MMPL family transporter [Deltaproteobacteria bacterium]